MIDTHENKNGFTVVAPTFDGRPLNNMLSSSPPAFVEPETQLEKKGKKLLAFLCQCPINSRKQEAVTDGKKINDSTARISLVLSTN